MLTNKTNNICNSLKEFKLDISQSIGFKKMYRLTINPI
jgi:hypothetical protein